MTEFTMGQNVPEPPVVKDTSVDKNKAILNYIMTSLRATKPWTRLLSILGFIGTGLTILVGLGLMVGGNLIPMPPEAPPLAYLGIFYILGDILHSDQCFLSDPFNMAFQVLFCNRFFFKGRRFGPARQCDGLPEILLEVCWDPGASVYYHRDLGPSGCDFDTGILSVSRITKIK
jgi:hypothetical protein